MARIFITEYELLLNSCHGKRLFNDIWQIRTFFRGEMPLHGDLGRIHKELTLIYLKALVHHWNGVDRGNQLQQLSVSEAVAV